MREIKFRAWGGVSMFYSHNNSINETAVQLSWFFNKLRENAEIMQFTGQKDKNRIEIYEGDILKSECGKLGKIEWLNNRTSFCVHWYLQLGSGDIEYCVLNLKLEIIGNIYENPELLNK